MAVGLSEVASYPGHSPRTNHFFAVLSPEPPQKAARSFFEISRLSSLSCSSLSPHSSPFPDVRQHSSSPWPCLSLFIVCWNCDLAEQVNVMLLLFQIGPFKVLTYSLLNSELLAVFTPGAASFLLPCFWRQHCDFLLGLLTLYTSTVQFAPSLS